MSLKQRCLYDLEKSRYILLLLSILQEILMGTIRNWLKDSHGCLDIKLWDHVLTRILYPMSFGSHKGLESEISRNKAFKK